MEIAAGTGGTHRLKSEDLGVGNYGFPISIRAR